MKVEFSRQIFGKSWNIKFHENPYSGSRDGQTDVTEVIVAFGNFANAPKIIDTYELKKNQSLGKKNIAKSWAVMYLKNSKIIQYWA